MENQEDISDLLDQLPAELQDMTSSIGSDPVLIAKGSDVYTYCGKVEPDGKTVALRIFPDKTGQGFRQLFKEYCRDNRFLLKLDQSNILKPMGIYTFRDGPHSASSEDSPLVDTSLGLVVDWMDNGTVLQYLANPRNERHILHLAQDIANGLAYLHEKHVVFSRYSILRCSHVLVSLEGTAKINIAALPHPIQSEIGRTTTVIDSVRWLAYEQLWEEEMARSESDVWSYGMTILEMLTGERPYARYRRDVFVIQLIIGKKLPDEPRQLDHWSFQQKFLWEICKKCWNFDYSRRPSMANIVEEMKGIEKLLSASHRVELLRALAPDLTDHVEKSSRYPVASGGFSYIYLGKSLAHGVRMSHSESYDELIH